MKKKKEKKEETNRFIQIIKKKWLINGTKTFILVAIIIAAFIAINVIMHNLELSPIDFSQDKLYSLTEESKEKVKGIQKDINIYFVNSTEDDNNLILAKQYNNVNERIVVEAIDIETRPDLAEKYGIEVGEQGIIIESGEKSKVLTAYDLITYDNTTYETISIAEEKLTNSILSVSSDEVPKVYFLEGYSDFTLENNMTYLKMYLENEINEIETLNIISQGKVPEDCKTLVITTPNKDFNDIVTNAIKDYINKGGSILWLNELISQPQNFPNVNSILALYGVNPFEVGMILETNEEKMGANTPYIIFPNIEYSKITENLYNTNGIVLVNATKINVDEEKLEELNVEKTDLLKTSDTTFFRTDFTINSLNMQSNEQAESFLIGTQLEKTIKEANEETGENKISSKLILLGENSFVSDYAISEDSQYPLIAELNNKDIILNSVAYLVDREEDITARKSTGTVTYMPTEEQNRIILIIIFGIPILIIITGIIVWILRRKQK